MTGKTEWLAKTFEENRSHLKGVALRILGSPGEAEDAIQEAWLRLTRSDSEEVENLGAWLTTVVARICLDMLRSKKAHPEEPIEDHASEEIDETGPEQGVILADAIGPALLIVLEALTPQERVAFVLHDLFDLSFEEIAPIIDRTEAATRQLASRARRKVRGAKDVPRDDRGSQRQIVAAFLAASRNGNFTALLELMNPNVVLRADAVAVKVAQKNQAKGAPAFESETHGSQKIAELFKGRAKGAQIAVINGMAGGTWAPNGKPVVVFQFKVDGGKITAIDVVMDPEALKKLEIQL
ncbi:MAG: sigma-70 family RNA polymerase sigma factor [Bdellovibrionia bacterium]